MTKDEQVSYLANLYHMLLSDGTVDSVEEKVFEQIAREIGAGYFERRNALETAQSEGYELSMLERFSDRIRNLEDMLFAAMCNGVVDAGEKKFIVDFATRAAMNQQQFSTINKDLMTGITMGAVEKHKYSAKDGTVLVICQQHFVIVFEMHAVSNDIHAGCCILDEDQVLGTRSDEIGQTVPCCPEFGLQLTNKEVHRLCGCTIEVALLQCDDVPRRQPEGAMIEVGQPVRKGPVIAHREPGVFAVDGEV